MGKTHFQVRGMMEGYAPHPKENLARELKNSLPQN
jgi:hypothetical protein